MHGITFSFLCRKWLSKLTELAKIADGSPRRNSSKSTEEWGCTWSLGIPEGHSCPGLRKTEQGKPKSVGYLRKRIGALSIAFGAGGCKYRDAPFYRKDGCRVA